jgi:iron(III) transport system permease protein
MISSRVNPLLVVSAAVAALVGLPVASVLTHIFSGGTGTTWSHLASTVLPDYVANTLVLCVAVGLGVIVIGVATAWLTAMHDFPGRALFEWALVLPMAMPAYVLAYVYTDFLQFVGPCRASCASLSAGARRTTGSPRFAASAAR